MARLRQIRPNSLLSRFCADRSGATAVEFAFIAFPFFTMLFVIMQTALVMFGSQALQEVTKDASRKLMTGQMKGKGFDDFKEALCNGEGMSAMFDCDKFFVQVQSFGDFGLASAAPTLNEKCFKADPPPTAGDCYSSGIGRNVVIVRVAYDWPFAVNLDDLDHKTRITAVRAFRNEPF